MNFRQNSDSDSEEDQFPVELNPYKHLLCKNV